MVVSDFQVQKVRKTVKECKSTDEIYNPAITLNISFSRLRNSQLPP